MYQIDDTQLRGASETAMGGITLDTACHLGRIFEPEIDKDFALGDEIPPLWHWFASWHPDEVSTDPTRHQSGKSPAVVPWPNAPRPIWGRGYVEFVRPIHIGELLERRTSVASVVSKKGLLGTVSVVNLDHQIFGQTGLAVLERQEVQVFAKGGDTSEPLGFWTDGDPDFDEKYVLSGSQFDECTAINLDRFRLCFGLTSSDAARLCPDSLSQPPFQANLLMGLVLRHSRRAPTFFSFVTGQPFKAGDVLRLQAKSVSETEWALSSNIAGVSRCLHASAIWLG